MVIYMISRMMCLFLTGLFALNGYADIGVSPIVADLAGKDADIEMAVKNGDLKNNAYVEITPWRVINPANHASPKQLARHPETDGILVFPAKIILLPGQTQYVRIVKTAKNISSDQVFEVDFIPKVATHLISQKNSSGSAIGIRVIVGYGARVILRPDVPSPSISVKRINKKLVIKNTGNTALTITSCTQQIAHQTVQIPLSAYTIFANQTITKDLRAVTPIKLDVSYVGKMMGPFYTN